MFFYSILFLLLSLAAIWDIATRRIPNWLTLSCMVLGVGYHALSGGFGGFLSGMAGLLAGLGLLTSFYLLGGMGAGDVKLMGAIGALLGPKGVLLACLWSVMVGGVYALVLLAACGGLRDAVRYCGTLLGGYYCRGAIVYAGPRAFNRPVLRYGVAIAIGTLLSQLGGILWHTG
ncbi:MAG: A24 family peptidase [Syntrophorhabdales bacterium]|jgi:prepilin peptidase CpaA